MIGTVLSNRYKLIAELGSGGMAWVYLAEDQVKNEKVAVKVLYPQYSQDLGFLQRFSREAKLSMTLSQDPHQRNIVRVLDYGADRDTHYLVMEYVPGLDLDKVLEQEGPMPWRRATGLTRQVAQALEHAHQLEIVHRDIKPSNVMVLPDDTVRVLDFGIARARTSPDLTLSGFVGSPHYAAPEQATGQKVDIRADIYSLGVVLYRMLSGSLPYQGDTPWAIVNQHIASAPPPLEECCPGLPKPVIQLVEKTMARRPEDRFQLPHEMVEAIDAVLAGLALRFKPLPSTTTEAPALDALYLRAMEAVEAERWQEAVDLFSQILKIDPDYEDATDQLAEVGQQIRLSKLRRAALRALHRGEWDRALTQLDRIAEIAPDHKDISVLRAQAENRQRPEGDEGAEAAEFSTQIPETHAVRAEAVVVAASTVHEVPAGAAPQEEPASRRRTLLWVSITLLALVVVAAISFLLSARSPAATPAAHAQPSPTSTIQVTLTPVPTTAVPSSTPTTRSGSPSSATLTSGVAPASSPTPTRTPPLPTATYSDTPTPTPSRTSTPTATTTSASITRLAPVGQIAFPRFDPVRGTYDVHVCQVDGSDCRRMTTAASQPNILPNGRQIVVHSWKADEKGLILLTLTGERIWRITDQIEAARPSVDFQGERYVYHSRQEADRQPRLYRTYGAESRPIVREASVVLGQAPSWLPDGRILYSGCWQNACGIIVMRADGTFPRQVVAGSTETNPAASPDGRRVAFMSRRDGNWEIYIANLDGSNLRRLTNDPANDGLPVWSPDGRYIAFVTDRDGPWAVWIMRPDGSIQRHVFDIGGPLEGRVRDAASHETHGWVEESISWGPVP